MTAAGKNFGWPCYEGNNRTSGYRDLAGCAAQYANEGTPLAATPPNFQYAHSLFPDYQAAVVAGPVYPAGGPYPSEYRRGHLLRRLRAGLHQAPEGRRRRAGDLEPGFATGVARRGWISSWGRTATSTSPTYGDGNTGTGSIKQVVYTPTNGSPVARATATPTSGAVPLNVQFTGSGSTDPNSDPLTYDWDFGDGTRALDRRQSDAHVHRPAALHGGADRADGRGGVSTRERRDQRRKRRARRARSTRPRTTPSTGSDRPSSWRVGNRCAGGGPPRLGAVMARQPGPHHPPPRSGRLHGQDALVRRGDRPRRGRSLPDHPHRPGLGRGVVAEDDRHLPRGGQPDPGRLRPPVRPSRMRGPR